MAGMEFVVSISFLLVISIYRAHVLALFERIEDDPQPFDEVGLHID